MFADKEKKQDELNTKDFDLDFSTDTNTEVVPQEKNNNVKEVNSTSLSSNNIQSNDSSNSNNIQSTNVVNNINQNNEDDYSNNKEEDLLDTEIDYNQLNKISIDNKNKFNNDLNDSFDINKEELNQIKSNRKIENQDISIDDFDINSLDLLGNDKKTKEEQQENLEIKNSDLSFLEESEEKPKSKPKNNSNKKNNSKVDLDELNELSNDNNINKKIEKITSINTEEISTNNNYHNTSDFYNTEPSQLRTNETIVRFSNENDIEYITKDLRKLAVTRRVYLLSIIGVSIIAFLFEFIITIVGLTISPYTIIIFIPMIIYLIHKIIVLSTTIYNFATNNKSLMYIITRSKVEKNYFTNQIQKNYKYLISSKNVLMFQFVGNFLHFFVYILFISYVFLSQTGINPDFSNSFLGLGSAALAQHAIHNGILNIIIANIVFISILIVYNISSSIVYWIKFDKFTKLLKKQYPKLVLSNNQFSKYNVDSRYLNSIYVLVPFIFIIGPILVFYFILRPYIKRKIIINWI